MLSENLFKNSIGLDGLFAELDNLNKLATPGYPPSNILQTDDYHYRIEMAVAGFEEKDLKVEFAENVLKVEGNAERNVDHYNFIHRGLAMRPFKQSFVLSPEMEIRDVYLRNGILNVEMERVIPDSKKPRTLEIRSKPSFDNETSEKVLLTEEKDVA